MESLLLRHSGFIVRHRRFILPVILMVARRRSRGKQGRGAVVPIAVTLTAVGGAAAVVWWWLHRDAGGDDWQQYEPEPMPPAPTPEPAVPAGV